jgi:hypothetical protein
MYKMLVIAAIALSLAGSLSATSAQMLGNPDAQMISRQSTTPSGAGSERPLL